MSLPYVVRPLDPWLGPRTRFPDRSRFRSTWTDTLALLDREVEALGATSWVLQMDLREYDLRKDGGIKANARPFSPAVRVSFTARPRGPLSFACDRYDEWQDNVRAVAKTLEALRAVDRYGVATTGEQYRGWTAISNRPAQDMTREQAAAFIAHWATRGTPFEPNPEGVLANPDVLRETYRFAAKHVQASADANDDTMARLNVARDLLQNGS